VELIITVAVLTVVMVAIGSAMTSIIGRNTEFRQRERVYVYENEARMALLGMVRDIRSSNEVMYFASGPVNIAARNAALTPINATNFAQRIYDGTIGFDLILVLEAVSETDTYTIYYAFGDSGATGIDGDMLVRYVHPAVGWRIGFMPAVLEDINIELMEYIPSNVPPDDFLEPTNNIGNVTHLQIEIVTPTHPNYDFRGSAFETTVAIQRRP
jgi:hypothetical protein